MSESSPLLLETKRFNVVRESYPDNHGGIETRAIIRHPGAAVVVPLLDDGRVCLERIFRVAMRESLVEIPAGTLEKGEAPQAAAHRELKEETGYTAERMEHIHEFYVSPGILDEKMYLFVATGLTPGEHAREAGERIENLIVPWAEALDMVFNGVIKDAKTIIGLLYCDRLKCAGKLPQRIR